MDTWPQRLRIAAIRKETTDTNSYKLESQTGHPIAFEAGQYLTFRFSAHQTRSYSISSAPYQGALWITVKRQPNGLMSRWLAERAQVGDELSCIGVYGRFVLPAGLHQQYIFFAAGSGIVPILPLIKELLHRGHTGSIRLVYSNRSKESTIFAKEIHMLSTAHTQLEVQYFYSNNENVLAARLNTFIIAEEVAQRWQGAMAQIQWYICGPLDYLDMLELALLTHGANREYLHIERFHIYTEAPARKKVPPQDKGCYEVSIQLGGKETKLMVQYPNTILDVALAQEVALPYSCNSGQCGSCTALCVSGQVFMGYNEALTDAEVAKGLILTCQGYPIHGAVKLSYALPEK